MGHINKMNNSGLLLPNLMSRRVPVSEVPETLLKPVIFFFQQPVMLAPFKNI